MNLALTLQRPLQRARAFALTPIPRHQLIIGITAFAAVPLLGHALTTQPWRLGIDIQEQPCLGYRFFIHNLIPPQDINRGQMLLVTPAFLQRLAPEPAVKILAALPGDRLDVDATGIHINGHRWGGLDLLTPLRIKPEKVTRHEIVPEGRYLMLGTTPHSFDGRYWGYITRTEIRGTAFPII